MNREHLDLDENELARDRLRYRRWLVDRIRRRQAISFLVETSQGQPVAGAILWLREVPPRPGRTHARIPRLHAVYTRPEFRRHGAAGLILTAAIRWVRHHGYPQIALRTTPMARRLYERAGFRSIPEMVLEIGRRPPRDGRGVRASFRATPRRARHSSRTNRRGNPDDPHRRAGAARPVRRPQLRRIPRVIRGARPAEDDRGDERVPLVPPPAPLGAGRYVASF
jgi:GNAT superfamily N-acetyltransferase